MTKLDILNGSYKIQSFDLKNDEIYIGRASDNDIQIEDKTVSRNHLKLIRKENEYFIRDLKSKNGTFVNGEKISSGIEFEVNEGVPISIGKSVICLTEECLGDVQSVQDSMEIPKKLSEKDKGLLKTRPFTFQKNMELMYKVCNALMESLNIDEISGKILEYILDLFKRVDRGVIVLIDNETRAISKGISRTKDGRQVGGMWYSLDIVHRVIEAGEAVIISDVYVEDGDGLSDTLKIMKIGSVMCVPFISTSQLWGVIYVDAVEKAHSFRRDDLDLLTAVSSPVALAIENAFLYSS